MRLTVRSLAALVAAVAVVAAGCNSSSDEVETLEERVAELEGSVTSTTVSFLPVTTEVSLSTAVAFTDALIDFHDAVTGEASQIGWEGAPERTYDLGVFYVDLGIETLDEYGWDCETARLTLLTARQQNRDLELLYRAMIEWLGHDLGKYTRLWNLMNDCGL